MAFFSLNGWNVPIINGGISESAQKFGGLGQSFTNRDIISRRIIPRSWDCEMLFQSREVADLVEGLVTGIGDHFPLDNDAWSDSGKTATTGSFNNITVSQTNAGFGIGSAVLSGDAVFDLSLPESKWTAIIWVYNTAESSPGNSPPVVVYDQYIEMADGTKYKNGESSAHTSFISVTNGLLTIDSATFPDASLRFDDLAILPYNITSSFAEELYRHQTASNCVMQVPFDYVTDYVDRVSGKIGVPTNSLTAPAGKKNSKTGFGSLYLLTPADNVEFTVNAGDLYNLDSDKTFSVSLWVRPDAVGSSQIIAEQFDGVPNLGWELSILASGVVRCTYRTGAATRLVDSSNPIPAGSFTHVVFTYKKVATTGQLELYINGESQGTNGATIVTPGTSNQSIYIGDAGSIDSLVGYVDDFRIYNNELSGEEIVSIYNQAYFGYVFQVPRLRPFSSLPRISVDGDFTGSKNPISVVGSISSERYVASGSSQDDRSISFTIEEVTPLKEEGIPRPDSHFILSPEYTAVDLTGDTLIEPVSGYTFEKGYSGGGNPPELFYDTESHFGFCYKFDSTGGSPYMSFDLPSASPVSGADVNFLSDLAGLQTSTMAMWFYIDSFPATRAYLFSVEASPGSRYAAGINLNPYPFFCGFRSDSGDSFRGAATTPANVTVGSWYFVCFTVDLQSEIIKIYGNMDGSGPTSDLKFLSYDTGNTWSSDYFTLDEGDTKIGVYGNGTQEPFDGKIKNIMFWRRELEYHEMNSVFLKGLKRRVFY